MRGRLVLVEAVRVSVGSSRVPVAVQVRATGVSVTTIGVNRIKNCRDGLFVLVAAIAQRGPQGR